MTRQQHDDHEANKRSRLAQAPGEERAAQARGASTGRRMQDRKEAQESSKAQVAEARRAAAAA